MYYINYFFIMSIMGHFLEYYFFSKGNSGILFGLWTPVYGVGAILIIIIYNVIKKKNKSLIKKIILIFILSSIILSTIEIIGGYIIKFIFNTELWNYKNHILNIGKYTSIEMSIIWGVSSIIFIYIIKPLIDLFVNKIPQIISYSCIIVFILDMIIKIYMVV